MKMNFNSISNMGKWGAFAFAFFFLSLQVQGQVATQILCGDDDDFCIALDSTAGDVQWEFSTDGSLFSVMTGETDDSLCVTDASDSTWYRARFTVEGCPILYSDTLLVVNVIVEVNAGLDSTYCEGESYQLGEPAQAGLSYSWFPPTDLNSSTLSNPTTFTLTSRDYVVTATDNNGCSDMDTVSVTIIPDVSDSVSFPFTGRDTFFLLPPCVDTFTVKLWGAAGNSGTGSFPAAGGEGGYVEGLFVPNPNGSDTLWFTVGGRNGFNGGGDGGLSNSDLGGNGGGSTDAMYDGVRIAVAGGGGGGGGSAGNGPGGVGGAGGALTGENGFDCPSGGGADGGFGATQLVPGNASFGGSGGCAFGGTSSAGQGSEGGTGGAGGGGGAGCDIQGSSGGGGGGGFLGGAGGGGGEGYSVSSGNLGGGGGGGGGSSNAQGLLVPTLQRGGNPGDGMVRIVW